MSSLLNPASPVSSLLRCPPSVSLTMWMFSADQVSRARVAGDRQVAGAPPRRRSAPAPSCASRRPAARPTAWRCRGRASSPPVPRRSAGRRAPASSAPCSSSFSGRTTACARSPDAGAAPRRRARSGPASRRSSRRAGAGRDDLAGHQVGHADEAGDEGRWRAARRSPRDRRAARSRPRFITAMRSDIVSASSWSCVT